MKIKLFLYCLPDYNLPASDFSTVFCGPFVVHVLLVICRALKKLSNPRLISQNLYGWVGSINILLNTNYIYFLTSQITLDFSQFISHLLEAAHSLPRLDSIAKPYTNILKCIVSLHFGYIHLTNCWLVQPKILGFHFLLGSQ